MKVVLRASKSRLVGRCVDWLIHELTHDQGCHTGCPEANGQAGGLAYYARRELGVLDIFSKYSFKIT
jgi:hypothetical protein